MTVEEMAAFLRQYEQAKSKTDPFRYTSRVSSVAAFPDVFGVNFPAVMGAPDAEKAAIFLAQEQRAELVRRLMRGQAVEDRALAEAFGFTSSELTAFRAAQSPLKKPLPNNLCVLCFDDSLKSQFDTALPLLEHYGFRTTFFITEMKASPRGPGFEDKSRYMTWEQIAALEQAGQELGNHSLHHVFGSQNMGADFNRAQITGMEAEFAAHGLKKPVSYAYPSGISNPDVVQCARECGYLWGRGNQEKGADGIRGMTYYDPTVDSPLAICNFGDPDFYTEELLEQRIAATPDGMIFGLTYHDVDAAHWLSSCSFERQMEVLHNLGMQVIAISDLGEYINPEKAYHYTIAA